jgi:hypothetical protein
MSLASKAIAKTANVRKITSEYIMEYLFQCFAILYLFISVIYSIYYIERNWVCQELFQDSPHYLTQANSRGPNAKSRNFVSNIAKNENSSAGVRKASRNFA